MKLEELAVLKSILNPTLDDLLFTKVKPNSEMKDRKYLSAYAQFQAKFDMGIFVKKGL